MKKLLLFSWLCFSVAMVWAQCTVHEISTKDTIVCGQSAVLSAFGQGQGVQILSEDFNSGSFGAGWSATTQAMWNDPCGPNTIDGSIYLWMGNSSPVPRVITTAPFNLSSCVNAGVTICFDMRYSIQGDASPCEGPDLPTEGVYLQYSTDNGATWNTIQYWDPNGGTDPHLTAWNQYCLQVPAAALVNGVKFRWYQDNDSGADYDHWGIDNVAIYCNDPSFTIVWTHDGYNAGPTGGTDPTPVRPHTTTDYVVVMSNGTVTCRDTVTVAVVNPIPQPNAGNDTSICSGTCVTLHGDAKIIERPAKVPTYHNVSPDTASLSSFGGLINQGVGVQLNIATLNMTNVLPNSILEVCVDAVRLQGIGINASDLQLVLMCPDSSYIILMPDSTATGNAGLFNYSTVFNQICFTPAGPGVNTGTPPYTGTFGTSQSFNNLAGCTANGVWTLLVSPTTGFGGATAIVTGWSITFNDPEIAYEGNFSWSPTTNMSNANTLNPTVCPPPNAYTLTVSDTAGCVTLSDVVNVTTHTCCSFNITAAITQPSCGSNNGSINLTVTPAGNYSFAWSDGPSTSQTRSTLAAGQYHVTVTDNTLGCTKDTIITLNSSSNLTVNFTNPVNPSCAGNDGSVTITLAGGTAPYSVTLDTGGTPQTFNIPIAGSQNIPGLHAGTINVSVTDAGGCQATATVTLTAPANCCTFTISITPTQPSCGNSNGSATVAVQNGSGNYTYAWSNGSTTATASGLPAGNISVTVTDNGQNCTKNTSATLNSNSSLAVSFTNPVNPTCAGNDGSVTITLAGGTTPYSVTLDTGGTPQTFNIPIAGSQNIPGLHAGTINVSVTDAGGCQANSSVTLTAATNCCVFTLGLTTVQPACGNSDGSASVTVQNGSGTYTYAWSNGVTTATVSNLPAGNMSVTVTDVGQGCSKDTVFALNSNSTLALNFSNQVNPTCAGNNGAITINLSGGTAPYTLTIDTGGTPQVFNLPVAGSQNMSNLNLVTINASVTDAQGCQASAAATLPVPVNTLAINNVSANNESCHGALDGSVSITVTGGTTPYSYLWSNNATSQNITGVPVGSYNVTITDADLCTTSTANISVNEPSLIATTTTATAQSCLILQDGTASVSATGGNAPYSYHWSDNASTAAITNLVANTYLVTVTDAHNCVAIDSATVALISSLSVTANPKPPLCPPLSNGSISVAAIGGTPGYIYRWSNGQSDSSAINLGTGNYIVTITDAQGCFVTDSFILQYQYTLSLDAGTSVTIKMGQGTVLTATTNVNNGLVYDWYPSAGLECATCQVTNAAPVRTIVYYVDAIDTNGCKATDSVLVEVIPDYNLFLPNAFTPNGDGNNDFFEMFGNKQGIIYWSITIFDRWGEKVYESNDINFKWDGTYRGKPLEPGVFVYAAKVVFLDNYSRTNLKGSLTLMR